MKDVKTYSKKFIYWIKKIMTAPLKLENCTRSIKPQDLISVVLVHRKDGTKELLISTTTSRLPLRVPATAQNIYTISLYCSIYESSEENDEDYIEIRESEKNEELRRENRKRLRLEN